MTLRPSDIYFSQDSISCYFYSAGRHSNVRIGDTLDDLVEGRCNINDIPTISVVYKNGRWVTTDNRRLWVFRHLERLGKCFDIPVYLAGYIDDNKMTSSNGGTSVSVRGDPGGCWYRKTIQPVIASSFFQRERYTYADEARNDESICWKFFRWLFNW